MMRLISLELNNSYLDIEEENNKFQFYRDIFHEFSFEELKDEPEEIFKVSDITPSHLQHEIIIMRIIQAYRKIKY